jgi:hypothetical protein
MQMMRPTYTRTAGRHPDPLTRPGESMTATDLFRMAHPAQQETAGEPPSQRHAAGGPRATRRATATGGRPQRANKQDAAPNRLA